MVILVLGATGEIGRLAVEPLTTGGQLRAAVGFGWEEPANRARVVRGEGSYVRQRSHQTATPFACSRSPRAGSLCDRCVAGALSAEHELSQSGADWTIVRASRLNQGSANRAYSARCRGRPVAVPASLVGAPSGDPDGSAEIGDAVLTDAGHAGRINEATEPRPMSFADAVEELAAATGRSIRYVRVSAERDAALIAEQHVPEEVLVRLTRVLNELLDGRGRGSEPAGAARRDGVTG